MGPKVVGINLNHSSLARGSHCNHILVEKARVAKFEDDDFVVVTIFCRAMIQMRNTLMVLKH